jgi:hypothetical protein
MKYEKAPRITMCVRCDMKKIIIAIVMILIFLICNLLGPYNLFQGLNEEGIAEDAQLRRYFQTDPIRSADYKGSNTYEVITSSEDEFVVIQEYFSVMNYRWKIYKQIGGGKDE